MTFDKRLRSIRDRLKLTQAEAARLLDVSKSIIEKWEDGARTPLAVTQEGVMARLGKWADAKGRKP